MDPKRICHTAAESLQRSAIDPKKLALLHAGAALALSLLTTIISFLLTKSMDAATGLAQMGTQAVLGTVQSVLSMVSALALPFWEVGFLYAVLRNLRFHDAKPVDFLEGFRRFRKVVRLYILLLGLYFLLFFLCSQVASALISFTPYGEAILQKAQALMDSAAAAGQTELALEDIMALLPAMIPMFVLMGVLLVGLGIPLFYRYRMAFFALMDDASGARAAMKCSGQITKGNKFKLFQLDLHFWWYYAAQLLCAVIAYGDVLLPAFGVNLTVSPDVLFFATYGIYTLLQALLAWQFSAYVQTAYGVFYDIRKAACQQDSLPQLPEG